MNLSYKIIYVLNDCLSFCDTVCRKNYKILWHIFKTFFKTWTYFVLSQKSKGISSFQKNVSDFIWLLNTIPFSLLLQLKCKCKDRDKMDRSAIGEEKKSETRNEKNEIQKYKKVNR